MTDSRPEELSPIKRALLEIRDLRARLDDLQQRQHEPVAIVGAALRFPGGATDLDSYWRLLRDGVDAITEVPPDRWDIDTFYDPDPQTPGKMSTRYGGFLDSVDQFDPQFFGISPREAASMDPQQRLLLEVTWEALENAGLSPDQLFGTPTGVFLGISHSDYMHMILDDISQIDVYSTTGSSFSIAGGRLSYVLGLQGPNISIDTACSSSLTAVHLAVQSLRQRESHIALAGGVSLILRPEINVNFSKSQMLATDGRCKTFDASADGYVRSEGCAIIVLKRLSDALADNDHILAVVRGTAINQDGRTSGLTAPNGPSQENVIKAALENARVQPGEVGYIEAHGTGTSLGDPIEVQALGAVFRRGRHADNPLMIGSAKTNIGHLEASAGVAGLLKLVLALKHQEIPPHLNLTEPSPYIPWADLPIRVPTERTPWQPTSGKRIGGVSSFGFSGTNAHVILEEAPDILREVPLVDRPAHVLTLSARIPQALADLAVRYIDFLAANPTVPFADVCFTANAGRAHLPHRLAIVADSTSAAHDLLAAHTAGETPLGVFSGQVSGADEPEIAFLFTGHGSHYLHMGRELYETQSVFREIIDQCDGLLRPYLDQSLLAALYPEPDQTSLLDGMTYTQPALFALQIALAALWRSWGIEPAMVLGHSIGEYAAAYVAGVFSLEDGIKLVAARGRLLDELPENGQMVAVFADAETVAEVIAPYADRVAIAVENGPQNIVISGAADAVEAAVMDLKAEGIKARRLAVAQASHSPLIDPMLDDFEGVAAEITYAEPAVALVSCTTGQVVALGEVTSAGYWRRHFRQPVRFATAVETLHDQGLNVFVEIGPNPTLLALGQRCLPDGAGVWLPSLREGVSDWVQMLESTAQLYTVGMLPDWSAFDLGYNRHRLPLPTYPFQRSRYWADVARSAAPAAPVWTTVKAAARRQMDQGPIDLALATYPQRWATLERLTIARILATLSDLDVFAGGTGSGMVAELAEQAGIQPVYHNLLRRWLNHLVALGLLTEDAGVYTCAQPLPAPDLEAAWAETHSIMGDLPFMIEYLERCGSKMVAVLTGAESPLETLFPGGSFALAENLYQNWAMSRYYAGLMQAALVAVVQALPAHKPVRVLEIGAGTGATTSALLHVLPADRTAYTFTDVSDMFLANAAQKFADYPFVRYGLLDIEQPGPGQGYAAHSFDVIVATNVLHATRNLHQTLQHVRDMLVPGGLLLLNEQTAQLAWLDITTGLIGGWQRFEDDLRIDSPLLKPDQWREALLMNEFAAVQTWPETGSVPEVLGQHVIIAQTAQTGAAAYQDIETGKSYRAFAETAEAESPAQVFVEQLQAALPDERHALLIDFVRQRVARVLRMEDGHRLDANRRLLDMGLDSLMALELRTMLTGGLALDEALPATLVFDYPTISAVADYLESLIVTPAAADDGAVAPEADAGSGRTAEIAEMSDDEIAAMLMKKFRRE